MLAGFPKFAKGFREKSTKTRIETRFANKIDFPTDFVLEKNPPKQGLKLIQSSAKKCSISVLEKNPPKQGLKQTI